MGALTQRRPRERDPDFMAWIASLPCAACLCAGMYQRRVQVAHLRTGSLEYGKRSTGMAEKPADRWSLPLCAPHHTGDRRVVKIAQHQGNELRFWSDLGVNPFQLCVDLSDAYAAKQSGSAVIARHAAEARKRMGHADQT